jgi:endonuclease III
MPRLAPGRPPAARAVLERLTPAYPDADTELNYRNAYELLVATILSAQSTDRRVNEVTPALFERYPDARTLAKATTSELEPQILATGFFRAKSRALLAMAQQLVERHGGEVPATMDQLVALAGVGRKTASVVLGHAIGVPALPVDRHVLRVSGRIGISSGTTPGRVEMELASALPPADWTRLSDMLILHGRRICRPKPLCPQCVVNDLCLFARAEAAAKAPPRGRRLLVGSKRGVRRPARKTGRKAGPK